MKVLFDHNVPHKLRHSMPAHDVVTAEEMGWSELENGELLRANNWNLLKYHPGPVVEAVDAAGPGSFQMVKVGSLPSVEP